MNRTRRTRVISAAILWLSLMFVGLSIYKDYGISWDEPRNRRNGMTSLKHVGERFAPNWVARDRDNQVRQRRLLWRSESELQDLFFLALTVGPVVGVIALDAVLSDGWRQLYFIAPTFILVSLRGWVALREWGPRNRRHAWLGLVSLATLLTLGHISLWMYRAHPYQNVYMNTFAGANPKARFDLDYWGLTNREALEYIVARDERRSITVWPGSFTPLGHSLLMLDPADRARVRLAETETAADYVVTNYRLDRRDYSSEDPTLHMFHQIRVCGEVVNSTYMRLAPRFPMEGEARN